MQQHKQEKENKKKTGKHSEHSTGISWMLQDVTTGGGRLSSHTRLASKQIFMCIAQNHKQQFVSAGFTICTDATLDPRMGMKNFKKKLNYGIIHWTDPQPLKVENKLYAQQISVHRLAIQVWSISGEWLIQRSEIILSFQQDTLHSHRFTLFLSLLIFSRNV